MIKHYFMLWIDGYLSSTLYIFLLQLEVFLLVLIFFTPHVMDA